MLEVRPTSDAGGFGRTVYGLSQYFGAPPTEAARTDAAADIALDVDALGSAYPGAVSFAQMRDGMLVEELRDGAVQHADTLFRWQPLPWCPEIF